MATSSAMQSILARPPLNRVVSNRSTNRVNQRLIATSFVPHLPRYASVRVRCMAELPSGPLNMESNSEERFYDIWLKNHSSALSSFEEIKSVAHEKQMIVFLDYDGTLSPIVNNPDQAFMSTKMCSAVREIGEHFPTAIIYGRSRDKVFQFVKLNNISYAGSHGMDISTPSDSLNYGNHENQTRTIDEKGNDMVNFCPVQDFLPRIQTV